MNDDTMDTLDDILSPDDQLCIENAAKHAFLNNHFAAEYWRDLADYGSLRV